jgi:hypothetical protein
VFQTDDINQTLQTLKAEITELEARLKDAGEHPRRYLGTTSSVPKRMLLSAQRVEELVSAGDRHKEKC